MTYESAIVRQLALSATDQQLQESNARAQDLEAVACPIRLERTTDPVWPDDEAREASELSGGGAERVQSAGDDESDAVLAAVTVALPDRLYPLLVPFSGTPAQSVPSPVDSGPDRERDTDRSESAAEACVSSDELVELQIPTSFSAPEELTLRRLRVRVVFSTHDADAPTVVQMYPTSNVDVVRREVGEVGLDLGKLIGLAVPQAADVFVARAGSKINLLSVRPRIQAAGLLKHECSWRVADPAIEYDFRPQIVVRHEVDKPLKVLVELHVELRKRVLGVWHRTYAKNADTMWYAYHAGDKVMSAFDYLTQLSEAERATRNSLPYRENDDASAGLEHLGRLSEEGWTPPSRFDEPSGSLRSAEFWYERAALAGNTDATLHLGMLLERRRDWDNARKWYAQGANRGDSTAALQLGNLDITKERYDDERLTAEAAGAGDTNAMIRLAVGIRSRPTDDTAERWLRRAASAGNEHAMFLLGRLVEPRSRDEAELWYRQAAACGHAAAKRELVRLHPLRFWYRFR